MNLRLIKEYEKEFLHMLHGGTILSRVMTSDEDSETYTIWYKVDDKVLALEKWTSDYLFNLSDIKCEYYKPQFIINDEYVEFRKALTEGRTVEVYTTYGLKVLDEQPWKLFAIGCSTFDLPVECYRIKSEEPRFKVGDWIRQGDRVFQYTYKDLQYDKANPTHCQNDEKWEPREGKICIFWDTRGSHAIIDTFRYKTNNKYHTENTFWDNCMPFTGVLPPHMKD